jgi:hypothetical protein
VKNISGFSSLFCFFSSSSFFFFFLFMFILFDGVTQCAHFYLLLHSLYPLHAYIFFIISGMGLACTRTQGNMLILTLKNIMGNVLNRFCRMDRDRVEAVLSRFEALVHRRETHSHLADLPPEQLQGDRELDSRKPPEPTNVCSVPRGRRTVDMNADGAGVYERSSGGEGSEGMDKETEKEKEVETGEGEKGGKKVYSADHNQKRNEYSKDDSYEDQKGKRK